ncbi:endonuclease [soil metagenome]
MSTPSKQRIIHALVDRHGRTYADEAGISIRDTPAPPFQLLVLSLLLSARISAATAMGGFGGLVDAGWTTPTKLAASTWEQRTKTLNESGYARYDESTARMLGDTVDLLLDRYDGDLRQLRDHADHDPDAERRLLQQFSGIGEVGAAIFSREVQIVWDEMYPFADRRALAAADRIGLGGSVPDLTRNTDGAAHFALVVAALVRCDLAGDHADIMATAGR